MSRSGNVGSLIARLGGLCLMAAASLAANAQAATLPVAAETPAVERLGPPGPHWVWITDLVGNAARLFNGDDGRMLGMVATTPSTMALEWTPDRRELFFAGAYYTRHTYGDRTDTVAVFDVETLSPLGEALLPGGPPKLANGYPNRFYSGILDGGRLMLVYNFSPATSVSVVDTKARTHLADVPTVGCGLVFPSADDSFLQLCGDGTVQRVRLGADGRAARTDRSLRIFDPGTDPLMDKGARAGTAWWFISFMGRLVRVDTQTLAADAPWTVIPGTGDAGWRPGGRQPLALLRAPQQLFVLMHEGGIDTHKQDGTEVWVFDLAKRERIQRIVLKTPASSIDLSQDDNPLMYAVNAERSLDIYAARSGRHLRSIEGVGIAPVIVQAFDPGP